MGQCEICTKEMEYNAIESDNLLEKLEKTDIGRDVLKLRNENRQVISNFKTNLMSDKSFFKGKVVDTKREGYGQNYADCFNYFGHYKNDLPQGQGAIITESQCLYGQFQAGVLQGKGKQWSTGTSFEGTFKNGERIEGRITNDNFTYSGQLKNDQYNGLGTLTLKNGTSYAGNFVNGLFHGEGELHFQNKCNYKGGFKEGLYNGYGEYRWANGDYFKGQYREGKRDGFGVLRIGQIEYSGNWVKGVREGHGTLTHESEFGFGTWRNNQLVEQ